MQADGMAEEAALVRSGSHQVVTVAQLFCHGTACLPSSAAVQASVKNINNFLFDDLHVVKPLLPRGVQTPDAKHAGCIHHVATVSVDQVHQNRVAFLDLGEAGAHTAERMRTCAANGGIEERRNAARTASDDHTSVTLQGIAAHLDRSAKALTTAHSLGSGDHVKLTHAFSTDGEHGLEHAELNRSGRFHLLNFPVGFDFPLAVNHTGGVACLSQR